jgi:sugar transferase EpsL
MRRMRDVLVAGAVFLLMLPALLVIAVGVWRAMRRPVFFRQQRAGRHGCRFDLLKFRTMREGYPGEPDELRLTPLGRKLRRLSLDELPQLWNVLRGDMSLVGPRPLPLRYLERYTPEQARRLEVLPGITGLVQVGGRNALTWDEKFALDVWYVDHRSFQLDLWILWRTLVTVVHREGVSAPGHATMPEFFGSGQV